MRNKLFLLIGFVLPQKVFGFGVEDAGGGAGIGAMWNEAAQVLPYRSSGNIGISIIVRTIVNGVLWFVGGATVIVILWAAIQIITSGINEEQLQKGKKTLMYASVGLILTILAQTIVWYVWNVAWVLAG